MSISCAPARSAAAVSATLASVLVAPSGNPTTVQTLTGEPASSAFTSGTQYGIHADAGEAVLARLAADLDDVGAGGVGLENGVVDQRGDGRDRSCVSRSLAETRSAPAAMISLVFLRAGLDAALHAAGADLVGQVEAFALFAARTRRRPDAGEDLLADLGDQDVEFRLRHDVPSSRYCCSMSMIFWTRA